MKKFIIIFLIIFCTSAYAKLDCEVLKPVSGADKEDKYDLEIKGEVDGLFARLAGANLEIGGQYISIQKDVLKDYPTANQLFIWERLIYLNCELLNESQLSDEKKLAQFNLLLEKMSFDPPKVPNQAEVQYKKILNNIQESLFRKDEQILPAMEDFLADPTERNWERVVYTTKSDMKIIEEGIKESYKYDANAASEFEIIITSTNQNITKRYRREFKETRQHWDAKLQAFREISEYTEKNVPTKEQAEEWLLQLRESYKKLELAVKEAIRRHANTVTHES